MSKTYSLGLALLLIPLLILTACGGGVATTTTTTQSTTTPPTTTTTPPPTTTPPTSTPPTTTPLPTTTSTTTETTTTTTPTASGFMLTSTSFGSGGTMPLTSGYTHGNISPQLAWSGAPAETVAFNLYMDDIGVDSTGVISVFQHWVIFNIPAGVLELAEGQPFIRTLANGATQFHNDYGPLGYGGPDPPPGETHYYRFRLYALDKMMDLASGSDRANILGEAVYIAKYTGQ